MLADAAIRYDAVVLADEIHADVVLAGAEHVPFVSLGPDVAARTVTFVSASKAFNLAGLHCALALAGNPDVADRIRALPVHRRGGPSTLGLVAAKADWTEGDEWLDAAIAHIGRQRQRLAELLADLPAIRWHPPEGTYLAWLDCRALQLPDPREPAGWFLENAKVALAEGCEFGAEGCGWARLSLATSGPCSPKPSPAWSGPWPPTRRSRNDVRTSTGALGPHVGIRGRLGTRQPGLSPGDSHARHPAGHPRHLGVGRHHR